MFQNVSDSPNDMRGVYQNPWNPLALKLFDQVRGSGRRANGFRSRIPSGSAPNNKTPRNTDPPYLGATKGGWQNGKLTPCKNRNHLGLFGCSGSKNLGNIRKLGNSKYSKSFRRCLTNHPKVWRSSVVAPGGASAVQMHCPAVSFSSMHTALDIENNVHQWIVGSVLNPKEQFYVFSVYQKLSISKRARMGEGLMLAQHRLGYVRLLAATCKPSTIITRLATMTSGSVAWAHR